MKTYQEFVAESYRFSKRSGIKHKDPFTRYDAGTEPKGDLGGKFQGGWLEKEKKKKEKVEEGIGTTVAGALGNPPVLSKRMKLKRALLNREVQKNVQKNKEKKYSGKAAVNEAGDWWHPDPEKDKKLSGKGPQMRAREDRGQSTSAQTKPDYSKRLKPGESYMDFAKRKAAERSKK